MSVYKYILLKLRFIAYVQLVKLFNILLDGILGRLKASSRRYYGVTAVVNKIFNFYMYERLRRDARGAIPA